MHACMHASNVGRGHRVGVDWIIPRCLKIEIPISVETQFSTFELRYSKVNNLEPVDFCGQLRR